MSLIFDQKTALLYESWCRSSEGLSIDRSIEPMMLALMKPRPGERVLDIGCGSGNHLLILNKMGLDISGIDASPLMVEKARQRLGHRCNLKRGKAEALPFDDNEFDLAVLINALEFFDDPLQALREAGRIAKRRVFVGVINSLSINGMLKTIQGYLGSPLFRHARFYNVWQLKSLLNMAYGQAPTAWGSVKFKPFPLDKATSFMYDPRKRDYSPFGSFLGVSVTLRYQVKADSLPLKISLKKAGRSLIGAKTFGDLNRRKGVEEHERGLPL